MGITTDHRDSRSLPNAAVQALVRPFASFLIKDGKPGPLGSRQLSPPSSLVKRGRIAERHVGNTYIYAYAGEPETTAGESSPPRYTTSLYYFAGGAFRQPPSREHWTLCAELAKQIPTCEVAIVSYPQAPTMPASSAIPHLYKFYDTIEAEAIASQRSIILMGDSSGGNLALVLGHYAAQKHASLSTTSTDPLASSTANPTDPVTSTGSSASTRSPLCSIFVISPPTDLRNTNPDLGAAEKRDPLLSIRSTSAVAQGWRGDWPLSDPRVSPLLVDDVGVFARTGIRVHGVVGTHDTLAPDALRYRDALDVAGVDGRWLVWERQMHCFPLMGMYRVPEGVAGTAWVVDVLRADVQMPGA